MALSEIPKTEVNRECQNLPIIYIFINLIYFSLDQYHQPRLFDNKKQEINFISSKSRNFIDFVTQGVKSI